MNQLKSPTLRVRVKGPLACFTRPELKVERVSYPVMTPSAARGLLEAILWKPAIYWHIERIHVLNEINFISFRRNEVDIKASVPSQKTVDKGGPAPLFFATENRSQRNTVALRDVDYVIEAYFSMTEKAGEDDNISKFVDMFNRRVKKGQNFYQPYFGCREFAAQFMPADECPPPAQITKELGIMLWDIEHKETKKRPLFFIAKLEDGILEVPADPEADFMRQLSE